MKHLLKVYSFIFVTIIISIVYIYLSLQNTQTKLSHNIDTLFISQAKDFASNLETRLKTYVKEDIYNTLKNNKKLRDELADEISILTTNSYKYIYILYRDSKGNYRFLADGSKENKGEFDEKLNVDKKRWDKAYNDQKPQLFYQNNLDGLWISYITPIVLNTKTQAIIGIDFSSKVPQTIIHAMDPLDKVFLYIFIAILIMLLILFYQTFLNFRIKKDAITDPLTQAYNRNYLRDLLKNINIAKYQIIMLDIDHFKNINDSYGHKVGDNILRDIAVIIQNQIRSDDIFIRFGGEEFLLFIHKEASYATLAKHVAQRIRKKIQETTFRYDELSIHITVSMGIACKPEHFKSINEAIKHADEMLYVAKREGRNKVISSASSHTNITTDKKLHISEVQEAIEKEQVVCYYQAIFNAQTKKIEKYEALVRIKKEDRLILPNDFLPKIMHTNIYNQLTKIILQTVFTKIKQHKVPISVNLNFSDILNNDIFKIIVNELEQNKAFASWLIIELLEYELLEANKLFTQKIKDIKSYGVKIAIDDFGTGFANYNVFQTIPIDIIKIDGSLVKNIDHSEVSQKIVHSIVVLTKELGIQTVAEFVHSKEVMETIEDLEVDTLQGFYLAKPMENLINNIQ